MDNLVITEESLTNQNYALTVDLPKDALECAVRGSQSKVFIATHDSTYLDLCRVTNEVCWSSIGIKINEKLRDITDVSCDFTDYIEEETIDLVLIGYCHPKFYSDGSANEAATLLEHRNDGLPVYFEYESGWGDRIIGQGRVFNPIFSNIRKESILTFGITIRAKKFKYIPCGTPCIQGVRFKALTTIGGSPTDIPEIGNLKILSSEGTDLVRLFEDNQLVTASSSNTPTSNLVTGTSQPFQFGQQVQQSPYLDLGGVCVVRTPCKVQMEIQENLSNINGYVKTFGVELFTDDNKVYDLGNYQFEKDSSTGIYCTDLDIKGAVQSMTPADRFAVKIGV